MMTEHALLIILIVTLGLIFDYTNGFHDAATVISTVIATRALTPVMAIAMAGVLNTIGATQISGVAHTVSSGLVLPKAVSQLMILSAVSGAIVWNFLTWYFALPTSSSYALVGGLIGSAFIHGGIEIVLWKGLLVKVILPMVFSPFIGFFLAFLLMKTLARLKERRLFRYLQIFSAGVMALAHGLNDAQKSMGIITLGLFASGVISSTHLPLWVILSCAAMMGLGTAFGGLRISRTVGFKITKLAPVQGFAAEVSSSCVILAASFAGMPLSSTQMIVGSVTGVGASKSFTSVKWNLARKLALAWFITLPGSACIAAGAYTMLNSLFSTNII